MAKILCVLYPDPVDGYPTSYPRDVIPPIEHYPGGQTTPTPQALDFTPGHLLGSVSGELGLRAYLESAGHTFVVTSDKDGPDSVFARELVDAEIVISQPFWPAYLTAERIAKAPKLRSWRITAGIGSDHVDLQAAIDGRAHGHRGHLLQQHQRVGTRGDDDPGARAQLHPVLRVGGAWRVEHRRLRRTLLRPGGDDRRHSGRRAHRPGRAPPAEAVRRGAALHRPSPSGRAGRARARAHLPPGRRVIGARCATWSPSTPPYTPRPSTSSTTPCSPA